IVVSVAALSAASTVFAPVAFALLFVALMWPLQRNLQRFMPRLLAVLMCVVAMSIVFLGFGWLIAWSFGRMGRWVVSESARFQLLYDQVAQWLEGHGIIVAGLWAEHLNVGFLLRTIQTLSGRVNSALSFSIVVFVYVLLGLMEVEDFARR